MLRGAFFALAWTKLHTSSHCTRAAFTPRTYAEVDDARVEAAFAAVRREHFLGPGPWPMLRWPRRYVPTPSGDPVYLYQDALFGIIPERGLNNGQPWLHAKLIAAAAPLPGEHVGAGAGYYTAIRPTPGSTGSAMAAG